MFDTIYTLTGLDPVALDLGFFQIRWYALAYVAGLLGAMSWIQFLLKKYDKPYPKALMDNFFTWAVLGVVLGGRLGYVMFYQPSYYLSNPLEILAIHKGGMSFHGGLIGVVLAEYVFCRRNKLDFIRFTDHIALGVPIGLFFGRIANFINGELWGRATDGTWGVIFQNAGGIPRHPSQLYEATLEGLVLFLILYIAVARFDALKMRGLLAGTFLMGYGTSRIIVEFFREPDAFLGYLSHNTTLGQWLSVPMVILGSSLVRYSMRLGVR